MIIEISETTSGELELKAIINLPIPDIEAEYRGSILLNRVLYCLEKAEYRVNTRYEFAPTAGPPSGATSELVAGQSESGEQESSCDGIHCAQCNPDG